MASEKGGRLNIYNTKRTRRKNQKKSKRSCSTIIVRLIVLNFNFKKSKADTAQIHRIELYICIALLEIRCVVLHGLRFKRTSLCQ